MKVVIARPKKRDEPPVSFINPLNKGLSMNLPAKKKVGMGQGFVGELGFAPNDSHISHEKNIETSVFLNQETVEVVVEVVVVEVVVTVVVVEVDWHIGHNNWDDQLAKELM